MRKNAVWMWLGVAIGLVAGLCLPSLAEAHGTISGNVKDGSGAPLKGVFVQARVAALNQTTNVLTDKDGRYQMLGLAPGDYEVKVLARGYKGELKPGVKVGEGTTAASDFAMQSDRIRWGDLSLSEHKAALPDGPGKDILFSRCVACHGISTMFGRRDEQGWKTAVLYMRTLVGYFLNPQFNADQEKELLAYLNKTYGTDDSELPRFPDVKPRTISDKALDVVYVDYDLPTAKAFPWSAYPTKDGRVMIPEFNANQVGVLDPKTGKIEEYHVPETRPAHIHSAVMASDGMVWAAESSGVHKVARFDPKTKEWKEFEDPSTVATRGTMNGRRHTVHVGPDGSIWSSGTPVTRFNPKTGEAKAYPTGSAYGLDMDKEGNVWFTQLGESNLGRIDVKTGQIKKWAPPTPDSGTRRMDIDENGMIWIAEFRAGKIARFDPKTETFKEFQLPGAEPTPYAFVLDKKGNLWYSSYMMDVMGRLDPRTGEVVEYPMPYIDNLMRELFLDEQGHVWFGTSGMNKVGYLYLKAGM